MNKFSTHCVVLLLATGLSGCASMSADECRTADWRTIGFEDGVKGMEPGAIARHRKACAKAGITPILDAYEGGRAEGLRQFCVPARGYDYGVNGGNYRGVCPPGLEDEFLLAYEEGRQLYELRKDVSDTERAIGRVDDAIEKLRADNIDLEERLVAKDVPSDERRKLLDQIKDLAGEMSDLARERDALIYELGQRQERLDNYTQH